MANNNENNDEVKGDPTKDEAAKQSDAQSGEEGQQSAPNAAKFVNVAAQSAAAKPSAPPPSQFNKAGIKAAINTSSIASDKKPAEVPKPAPAPSPSKITQPLPPPAARPLPTPPVLSDAAKAELQQTAQLRKSLKNASAQRGMPGMGLAGFVAQQKVSVIVVAVAVVFSGIFLVQHGQKMKEDRLAAVNDSLEAMKYEQAALLAERALLDYPEEMKFHVYKGRAYEGLGRNDDALNEITFASAKLPNDLDVLFLRAKLETNLNKLHNALTDYQRLAGDSEYGKKAAVLANLATVELLLGKAKPARTHIDAALKIEPGNSALYAIRAQSDAALHDYSKAIKDCNTVLTAIDYLERASRMTKAGSAQKNEMVTALPDEVAIRVLRAQSYEKLGDDTSAKEDYSRAIKRAPGRSELYTKRGLISLKQHDNKQAVIDFTHAIDLSGDLIAKQKLDEISKHDRTAIAAAKTKSAPPPPHLVLTGDDTNQGYQLMVNGYIDQAVEKLTRAVQKDPNNFTARRYLAHCYRQTSQNREAAKQFSILLSMHKLDQSDLQDYASAMEGSGKPEAAAALYEQLSKADPANVKYRLALARVYSDMGNKAKVLAVCAEGLKYAKADTDLDQFTRILKDAESDTKK